MAKRKTTTKRAPYNRIGKFVSLVNSIEFHVNVLLEKIILQYSMNLEGKKITNEIIDLIEEQSLRRRINYIILFLSMISDDENNDIKEIIKELKSFSTFYNKHIRDVRDFVAHNPVMEIEGDKLRIISSRRYKGKLDSLTIQELEETTKLVIEQVKLIFNIVSTLSKFYPIEVVREIG